MEKYLFGLDELTTEQQKEKFEKIGRAFIVFMGQYYPEKKMIYEAFLKILIAVNNAKEFDKINKPNFYTPAENLPADFLVLINKIESESKIILNAYNL